MDEEFKRMRWASRRGMLELDLILGPFMDTRYAQLADDDRARYRALMACEDQDLFAWLMRREAPQDPELVAIIGEILAFHHA